MKNLLIFRPPLGNEILFVLIKLLYIFESSLSLDTSVFLVSKFIIKSQILPSKHFLIPSSVFIPLNLGEIYLINITAVAF